MVTENANITVICGQHSKVKELLDFGSRLVKIRCSIFPRKLRCPGSPTKQST